MTHRNPEKMKSVLYLRSMVVELNALPSVRNAFYLSYRTRYNGTVGRGYYLLEDDGEAYTSGPSLYGTYIGSSFSQAKRYLRCLVSATKWREQGSGHFFENCPNCGYGFRRYLFEGNDKSKAYQECLVCGHEPYTLRKFELTQQGLPEIRACIRCGKDLSKESPVNIRVTAYRRENHPPQMHCLDCFSLFQAEREKSDNSA